MQLQTTSPLGSLGVTPNAFGVPGQMPATQTSTPAITPAPITTKVSTTLSANNLGAAKPFTPPTPNPSNTAQNTLGAAVAPTIPTDDPNRSDAVASLMGLESGYNKSQDTIDQNNAFGVNSAQTAKNKLDAEAMSTGKYFDDQIESIRNGSSGATQAGVNDQVNVLTRQKNSTLADIAIRQAVTNGNFEQAQKLATQKVEADAEGVQNKINATKDYIAALDASPSEKAKMQVAVNAQQSALDEQKQKDLKDYQAKIDAQDPTKIADTKYKIAETNKINIENAQNSGNNNVQILDGNGRPINIPISIAPYYNTSSNGVPYINGSDIQGTATDKKKAIQDAEKAGIKVILDKNQAADLVNIKDANSKLDTMSTIFNDISQPNALIRDLGGAGLTQLAILAQTNPKEAASQGVSMIGLDILKAVSGVQGFRGNQTAIEQVQKHLPKATDTADLVKSKLELIKSFISDRENAIVGKPKADASSNAPKEGDTKSYQGTTYKVVGGNWVKQ